MTKDEALRMALEALKRVEHPDFSDEIVAIKEALAQPVSSHGNAEDLYLEMSKHLNCPHCGGSGHIDDVAQPEQEPVLEITKTLGGVEWKWLKGLNANNFKVGDKLYTTPPQPKEPEQEPVAKVVLTKNFGLPCLQWLDLDKQFEFKGGEFLYTHPPVPTAQPEKDIPKIGCVNHDCDKCKAQPEHEPSYWLGYGLQAHTEKPFEGATPVYTTPPQRKPLTDEQKYALIKEHLGLDQRREGTVIDRSTGQYTDAARYFDLIDAVIEAAQSIKGDA